jgi:hypothetical protein
MANFTKKFPVPGKTAEVIYSTVSNGLEHFLSKTPLGAVDIDRDEAAKKVSFKSSMASGSLTASDGSLQVDISLSFLASAFKGKIDEGVSKWISKTFPA